MGSFLILLEDTKRKLGRQLQKNEIDFLHWMYDRYENEQKEKCKCLKAENIN